MSSRVKDAFRAVWAANRELSAALEADYPPDTPIRWQTKGDGPVHEGRVVENCYGDRLMVRNSRTGRVYPIYASWIVS
jgi:hypothetical protein